MLKRLGNLIEKRPWLVISIVLFLTIGFATLIPGLEMKTDFADFMPEDEVVKANWRIMEYFGQSQQVMFLYVDKNQAESVISPNALKEISFIEKELVKLSEVKGTLGLNTILDQACTLEFGTTLENSSDEQINIVINDLLGNDFPKSIKIFNEEDKNEKVDYNRYPRIFKGKSIDEIDIKNCYVSYDKDSIIFSIEVYDLSTFKSNLKSPIPLRNVVEWYIDFENIIRPDEMLDIDYKISAHIEPKHSIWEIGKGPLKNLKTIIQHIRNRELFNSYKKEAYLWVRLPDQPLSLPIELKTAEINFNSQKNLIEIKASREEFSKYGIAIRFGFFELPAKLTNFKAGSRYYKAPIGELPWFRISANTSFLLKLLEKIQERPFLSKISENIFKKFANFSWEDFDELFTNVNDYVPLPDQIALKDMEASWVNSDISPDSGISKNIIFIRSPILDEFKISALSFLSKDFEDTGKPSAGMIFVYTNLSWEYNTQLSLTRVLLEKIEEIDKVYNFVTVEATGDSVISVQMDEVTVEANQIIMPMIFITIIFVLFIFYRRVSYVFLPLLALVVSTIWIFGTMVVLGMAFTTMSIAIVPLIMGLGVDYSVHLSHNYRVELSKGKTPAEAIKISVLEIGTAMFLAMLTTVIAFLSFLSATIPPLRDFGLMLALGIFYTFITAITLQAAVRYLVDRKESKIKRLVPKTFRLNLVMGIFAQKILRHQKKILGGLILITVIAGLGATQIETGFNFESFMPEDSPAVIVYEKIQENFPFVGEDQEYILLEGDIASVDALKGIKKTHQNVDDDTFIGRNADGSPKVESIYSIIVQATNNNLSLIENYNIDSVTKIPKTDNDVKRLFDYFWENQEYGIQTQLSIFRSDTGTYEAAIIRVYIDIVAAGQEGSDLEKNLRLMTDELENDLEDYGKVDAVVTGALVITHKITSGLTESQMLSTAISLVLATIVLIVAYRRFTLGIIAILPVLISIIWILGTMVLIDYSLNVLTITVTSLTIGIGVDYAIHATERFKLVADKTGDIQMAVCETIERSGGGLIIAAITTVSGFGMLIFAPIPPQVQFGVIMVMTITYSLITSILYLPLMLARWAIWSKKRNGYIISSKPPDEEYLNDIKNNNKK
jgi:hydrophobe/amphiphile efflux-3 (HAE3) family protein